MQSAFQVAFLDRKEKSDTMGTRTVREKAAKELMKEKFITERRVFAFLLAFFLLALIPAAVISFYAYPSADDFFLWGDGGACVAEKPTPLALSFPPRGKECAIPIRIGKGSFCGGFSDVSAAGCVWNVPVFFRTAFADFYLSVLFGVVVLRYLAASFPL